MLYLSIDQHNRQLTVNSRDEDGTVRLKRQVSTKWEKVRAFFADFADEARPEGGFMAILEVCGMNPWLVAMLSEYERDVVEHFLLRGTPFPARCNTQAFRRIRERRADKRVLRRRPRRSFR
jgi:hypothetical protein